MKKSFRAVLSLGLLAASAACGSQSITTPDVQPRRDGAPAPVDTTASGRGNGYSGSGY